MGVVMKLPSSPPSHADVIAKLSISNPDKALKLLLSLPNVEINGNYLHWDKLKYLTPPTGMSSEEWWATLKYSRSRAYKALPFVDKRGKPIFFSVTDGQLRELHWLDKNCAGSLHTDQSSMAPLSDSYSKDVYIVKMLINEAIYSSQIEGASTTKKAAKEMLYEGRPPHNRSEQMIYNNYRAMKFILDHKGESLTPLFILDLHKILSDNALDNPDAVGKFRITDDIFVLDPRDNEVLHVPPPASQIPGRIKTLCEFANSKEYGFFIHPIYRAILLHFMLAYDHPFEDGNGRTARGLFYWSAINSGYWLFEFISISSIIKRAVGQYAKAFLYTETDENDTTYFLSHQLTLIRRAVDELHAHVERRTKELKEVETLLDKNVALRQQLNSRQISLLRHALKHIGFVYTINEHKTYHNIAYESARKDLLEMGDKLNLFVKKMHGKAYVFEVPPDIERRITFKSKRTSR